MQKINGGIQKELFVERDISFVTLTFSADITDSAFDIPNSCLDNAVQKLVERKATVLGVSELYNAGTQVDVMLGHASGWTSDVNGSIASAVEVDGYEADLETILAATVDIDFAVFSGLRAAASGDLVEFEGEYFRSV